MRKKLAFVSDAASRRWPASMRLAALVSGEPLPDFTAADIRKSIVRLRYIPVSAWRHETMCDEALSDWVYRSGAADWWRTEAFIAAERTPHGKESWPIARMSMFEVANWKVAPQLIDDLDVMYLQAWAQGVTDHFFRGWLELDYTVERARNGCMKMFAHPAHRLALTAPYIKYHHAIKLRPGFVDNMSRVTTLCKSPWKAKNYELPAILNSSSFRVAEGVMLHARTRPGRISPMPEGGWYVRPLLTKDSHAAEEERERKLTHPAQP